MSDKKNSVLDTDIRAVSIEHEMKSSYLDYAMSVIVGRALPDIRDGLKPVHRRILFSMKQDGYDYNKPFKKSAYIVGGVMARFHPHGDSAIYHSMVRMAQSFSLRVPLIQGQGNFGSMDGDPPASFRYTEARMSKAAHAMTEDIDKDTVNFRPNYDETLLEPSVLPARFPNLLVNGAEGIAVGMATSVPTHNLSEVIDACCAFVDNRDITIEELMEFVKGPDFPTGAIILGRSNILQAYRTGRGSIIVRGRTEIEEIRKGRMAIIISEIPYQVNKAKMVERIAETVKLKIIEGISEIRDESNRTGVRVVVELKKDASPDVVLNQLFKFTPLQTSISFNVLALYNNRPELLNLQQIIKAFVEFREEVITRRSRFLLRKAREKANLLVGLGVAVANIDEVIRIIRAASDPKTAKENLLAREWDTKDIAPFIQLVTGEEVLLKTYQMSEEQAKAILDLRLHRLTGLEREKILDDLKEVVAEIERLLDILSDKAVLYALLKQEMIEVKDQFGTPRKTEIQEGEFEHDIEDLIEREDMVVTVTMSGYIRRSSLLLYRAQRRGGKGRSGMATRDEDAVQDLFVANTHTPLLFFTTHGQCYKLKVYRLPEGTLQSRGKALVNLLPLEAGERIATIMPMPEDEAEWANMFIMFATNRGNVRRNRLSDFTQIRSSGKKAIRLDEGENLISVQPCYDTQDVLLASRDGKSIRFSVTDIRVFAGRDSNGVRAIRLAGENEVVSMSLLNSIDFTIEERNAYLKMRRLDDDSVAEDDDESTAEVTLTEERFKELQAKEEYILTLTDKGYGKRTSSFEYRVTHRGGQGLTNIGLSAKNGKVISSFPVGHGDDIVLMSDASTTIRCPVEGVRICGRTSQGVIVIRLAENEKVISTTRLDESKIVQDDAIDIEVGIEE
ncbi:DNA gyrase subunit A [Candidatus Bodocaedibacter vickermanii]|uniref:DNA gyrase subunit A n=1 Tax=Candidatus Bodocaedibacter vickermanii TaxID=2741701 RepID=A0A7L9RS60_9PROT|nr:DNA gyrase subunit A [Candidatus Paracaedibacteraceae bacterium 'Lake Konstanz']